MPDLHSNLLDSMVSGWLDTRNMNLAMLEDYYVGMHPTNMLTQRQRDDKRLQRFWKPVNICALVIDEPIGYLAEGKYVITCTDEAVEEWARDYFQRRIQVRLDDLIRWQGLFGESYLYFWTDRNGIRKGLKCKVIPPMEGGKERILADFGGEDDEELTAAQLHYRAPTTINERDSVLVEYRVTLTPDIIRVDRMKDGVVVEIVRQEANPSGVIPVVPVFNPHASDILQLLPIQDDLNKLHFDLRQIREYHGFPMITTTATDTRALEVGPGKIASGGDFKRIEPGDITQVLNEREALLATAAQLTSSLVLMDRTSGDPSGLALRFLQQNLESKMLGKATRLATGIEIGLETAARILAVDPEMYALEVHKGEKGQPSPQQLAVADFSVAIEPRIPADENAIAKRAIELKGAHIIATETAMQMVGIENVEEEMDRVDKMAAEEAARFGPIPGSLLGGFGEEPGSE